MDPIIKAKADRFANHLRKVFGVPIEGDEGLIERGKRALVRGLSLEKARREKKRKKHEQTVDMFSDRD